MQVVGFGFGTKQFENHGRRSSSCPADAIRLTGLGRRCGSAKLARFAPLAPLHQPNPCAIRYPVACRMPQVACFDTAFHQGTARCGSFCDTGRFYADRPPLLIHGPSCKSIADR
jgi:hypothetical protein